MKIPGLQACHLSYCTNIHPGESWLELKASLQEHLPRVKKRVCADAAFGVGLRLSAQAAAELHTDKNELISFKRWLDKENLYVFTLNGFPYGTFHGQAIKEQVYLPDWSSSERLDYTKQLAEILAYLLPEAVQGSISTVPVGFKENFQTPEKIQAAVEGLLDYVVFAYELEQSSGKQIALALEPEPGCYLEDTQGSLDFFERQLYSEASQILLKEKNPGFENIELATIKRYLGVCLDTCHAAVMFEDPIDMAKKLQAADINIPKVQLTAALKMDLSDASDINMLRAFAEGHYLHQTSLKKANLSEASPRETSAETQFFLDLPQALQFVEDFFAKENFKSGSELKELRSHFHVPVFVDDLGGLQTTQTDLQKFIHYLRTHNISRHYEVETYTFNVLPPSLLTADVDEAISRELQWVLENLR